MKQKILVIEDEPSIQNIIRAFLEDAGYEVSSAVDGAAGIAQFHKEHPDLVLLDLMLPKVDGYTVCEIIRKESKTPIIMMTALDDEDSQIKGFDALADDYITKPFSMPLVLRRIEAVLRRGEMSECDTQVLLYKEICMNLDRHEVFVDGVLIDLTAREFDILKLFMENPGRVFTRESLLSLIWHYEFMGDEKIINTHVKNTRKKLGADYIETIRGVGYKLDK